jgi:hypothetical protein
MQVSTNQSSLTISLLYTPKMDTVKFDLKYWHQLSTNLYKY